MTKSTLVASDPANDSQFGRSVSLHDDQALVGAVGAAYVFQREGTSWVEAGKLVAGSPAADFGISVSLDEDAAVVGAPFDLHGGLATGAAYLFERTAIAHADFRNGGTNPASLSVVDLPELGSVFRCEVDLAGSTGHTTAMLAAYFTPATFALGGGQVVLVNVADPFGELLGLPAATGPIASYGFGIPSDPSIAGLECSTQAIHLGGVVPFALSNALDLFVGN